MRKNKVDLKKAENYDIAIIGGGASSVAMMKSILRYYKSNKPINIIIFSYNNRIGPGYAYQKDVDSALLNRPLHSMSIDKFNEHDAVDWLQKNPKYYNLCHDEGKNGLYMPRWVFGHYLEERMLQMLMSCQKNNINVNITYDKVIDIRKDDKKIIQTETQQVVAAKYIIYCCGHNSQRDIYHLMSTDNYVHNPYPLSDNLNHIPADAKVAVIGSSLTAIDIALSLNGSAHSGPIDLLSRNHVLPYVRGPINKVNLNHLNELEIEKTVNQHKTVNMKDLVRLLKNEMDSIGYDWKELFRNDCKTTVANKLSSEILATESERKWQSALVSTNTIIEKIWHSMSDKAKQHLIEHYNRPWLNSRSPIPVCNARKLMPLLNKGAINYRAGLKQIKFNPDSCQYEAEIKEDTYTYDFVINASGPSKYPLQNKGLLANLIRKGYMKQNQWGGIEVDYSRSNIIEPDGRIDRSEYMVGQNTSGVHYYTTSLEMIVNRCNTIGKDLVSSLH